MQLRIVHRTAYRYDEPVKYSAQALRLTPRREGRQRVLGWSMHAPGRRVEQVDAHGNVTHLLTVEDPHKEIEIVVTGDVEVASEGDLMPHEGQLSPLAYLFATPLTVANAAISELAQEYLGGSAPLRERLYALAGGVGERVRYQKGSTSVEDSAAAVLARGEGVCQDQAHVFISCCRAVGVPARYVSGYLYSGNGRDGDGTAASHAWVDAWIPDSKAWLGIDVTHREPTGMHHCRLAVGRDYLDAAPVRGVRRGGGREMMDVDVLVSKASDQ
jgi:transglutaminase-like putative cysteine protease